MNNDIKKIIKNKDKDELRKKIIRANYAKAQAKKTPANLKNVRPINNKESEQAEPIIKKSITKDTKKKSKPQPKLNDVIKDERKINKPKPKAEEPKKLEVAKKQMDRRAFLDDKATIKTLLEFNKIFKDLGFKADLDIMDDSDDDKHGKHKKHDESDSDYE